jgi:hypothetical protein
MKSLKTAAQSQATDDSDLKKTQTARSKLKAHQQKKKTQRLDRLEKMYNELSEK